MILKNLIRQYRKTEHKTVTVIRWIVMILLLSSFVVFSVKLLLFFMNEGLSISEAVWNVDELRIPGNYFTIDRQEM